MQENNTFSHKKHIKWIKYEYVFTSRSLCYYLSLLMCMFSIKGMRIIANNSYLFSDSCTK